MKEFKFKPEFGNVRHIEIVDMIGELRKLEEKLEKRIDEYMTLRNLKEEIKQLETSIDNAIKNEGQ